MTADRSALHRAFGDVVVSDGGDYVTIARGPSEARIRTALASLSFLHGWDVQEEVVVPGWGRIDLILRDGVSAPTLIELKIDMTKPARVRKAFQQADGYGRWWTECKRETPNVVLIGVDVDSAILDPVASAYLSVHCMAIGLFIGFLETGGTKAGRSKRAEVMRARRAGANRLAELHRVAEESVTRAVSEHDVVPSGLGILDLIDLTSSDGAA